MFPKSRKIRYILLGRNVCPEIVPMPHLSLRQQGGTDWLSRPLVQSPTRTIVLKVDAPAQ